MSWSDPHPNRRSLFRGAVALMVVAPIGVPAMSDPWSDAPWRKFADKQWRSRLPGFSYDVLRHEATEAPFTSPLNMEHRQGGFSCLGCGLALFKSQWKYDSGTGWPSFFQALPHALGTKADFAIGAPRTEYHCARCLGHQGHVFDDGPRPTGLRYCNNGVALSFSPS
jgi:peptide-methionine (R)-S-oxide reductase